jgi:alcohol dehydrogenase (cytochrome c)
VELHAGDPAGRHRHRLAAGQRGVGILDDTVYLGTVHGHLIALDARSGAVRWDVTVQDNKSGYYLTLSPLALDGKVIVGVSGAETGIRGFVDAYDSKSGQAPVAHLHDPGAGRARLRHLGQGQRLADGRRFHMADRVLRSGSQAAVLDHRQSRAGLERRQPSRRQPLHRRRARARSRHRQDEVALPVHAGRRARLGLEPDVILFEATVGGRERKLLGQANRNGFYYVLDRETGAFITGVPYAKQTWADGLDPKGRPIRQEGDCAQPRGHARVPQHPGRGELAQPELQPADEGCSTSTPARWGPSTTRATPCTSRAPRSPAAAAAT